MGFSINSFEIAGIAVLVAAGFLGYMLALLQRRVGTMASSQHVSNMIHISVLLRI